MRSKKRRSSKLAITPTEVAPSEAFRVVDAICRLAEAYGWPREQAFQLAMVLRVNGTTVSEARELLADAGRQVQ